MTTPPTLLVVDRGELIIQTRNAAYAAATCPAYSEEAQLAIVIDFDQAGGIRVFEVTCNGVLKFRTICEEAAASFCDHINAAEQGTGSNCRAAIVERLAFVASQRAVPPMRTRRENSWLELLEEADDQDTDDWEGGAE